MLCLGEALNKHLPKILPALLTSLADSYETADQNQNLEYAQTVVLSVNDEIGVSYVIDILLDNCRSQGCLYNPIIFRSYIFHNFW